MSERPFMQLYVSDFVGDTLTLSTEHIGAYLLLLIALWNAGGSLPEDEVKLSRVARLNVERWREVWAEVMPFFEVHEGRVTHHRLTKELEKFAIKSEARAEAGRRGGFAKALKDKNGAVANAMPLPRHLPETRIKEGDASHGDPTEGLAVVASDSPDFRAITKLRNGKRPIVGKSGSTTVTVDELTRARAAYGLEAQPA